MPKVAKSSLAKINDMMKKYPGEFEKSPFETLHCISCNCSINFEKMFYLTNIDPQRITKRLTLLFKHD